MMKSPFVRSVQACFLCLSIIWVCAGCALGDLQETPPAGPIIIIPTPPKAVFYGDCETAQALDQWLQPMVTYALPEFQMSMDQLITLDEAALRGQLLALSNLRETVVANAAPDCAAEAHAFFLDMLNRAIGAVNAYLNGEEGDLNRDLITLVGDIDVIQVQLDELMVQLETQYRE